MLIRPRVSFLAFMLAFFGFSATLNAQHPANANPFYQQLRGLLPGGEVIAVNNLELKRDAATFTFRSGNFAFYGQVNGKVTGAVFKGDGHFHITPPTAEERHNLSIVNHSEEFDEDFDEVVLRFTDGTDSELRKASAGPGQADAGYAKTAQEFQSFLRRHSAGSYLSDSHEFYYRKIEGNLDLRLLADVLSPARGGFFYAAIHGRNHGHLFFEVDPLGVAGLEPEEVALENWDSMNDTLTYPLAFYRAAEYANGTASGDENNSGFKVLNEDLDVGIEKNGFLTSVATVELRANQDGVAVIPLDLYPTLRVSKVETDKGAALDFVQEDKGQDSDFGVVLAAPLRKDETATLKITYAGKDVVFNEGGGNYYTTAREDWFPNGNEGLGDYASYNLLFHVPKGLQLIATGTRIKESTDGNVTTTEWKTDAPLPVVGFTLGDFMQKEAKLGGGPGNGLTVDAYANNHPSDVYQSLEREMSDQNVSMGSLDTTPMLGNELSQGEVAAQIYTNYFGPLSFAHIALTQQAVCSYGQSWPMLVFLPNCGFLDKTQRFFLIKANIQNPLAAAQFDMYLQVVTPHEVSHQWWGHTVGFKSYRDQWMSEGFADESATIFLQATQPKLDQFFEFWKQSKQSITAKNQFGFRPIDVGPVTMGIRLNSPKTGFDIYQNLVYPKGAFILHMIRMMMWSPTDGDARFKETMHDFVNTYRMRAATTEDFKAIVEKHMNRGMDLEGNQKMDWFFREYVYGTDLPAYHFEGQVTPDGEKSSLHFKLIQSGVPPEFRMAVPMYMEFTDGKVARLGSIVITGDRTVEQTLPLPKLPSPVKRISINYYYDVLCTDD